MQVVRKFAIKETWLCQYCDTVNLKSARQAKVFFSYPNFYLSAYFYHLEEIHKELITIIILWTINVK